MFVKLPTRQGGNPSVNSGEKMSSKVKPLNILVHCKTSKNLDLFKDGIHRINGMLVSYANHSAM